MSGKITFTAVPYFNPRSRVGNDYGTRFMNAKPYIFQSTFPRGERHGKTAGEIKSIKFQSTFPRGERPTTTGKTMAFTTISIHVPAWGTTLLS